MDALAELLKTAQSQTTPMRHRMRAAQQALRAIPTDAPEEVWKPFRDLFDEVVQHKPAYAEVLRTDALNVGLWWDGRRRPVVATVAAPADQIGDAVLSASLSKMRQIMLDDSVGLNRRLDAAEVCLDHELGPGAGVGVPPDEIASQAYQFCRAVADSNAPETPRFRALRAMVRIENVRKTVQNSSTQYGEKRELLRCLVNAERRRLLAECGRWPPGTDGWALRSNDTFDWPEGWPGDWAWPPADCGERLDAARCKPATELQGSIAGFRAKLRAVRATNRRDHWEELLEPDLERQTG